jgi:hypothetical protein
MFLDSADRQLKNRFRLRRVCPVNRRAKSIIVPGTRPPTNPRFQMRSHPRRRRILYSDYSKRTFPVTEAQVDHEIEFEEILRRFAEAERIDLNAQLLTIACDARSEPEWIDPMFAARFLDFHETFPLRLVSIQENLSELRRGSSRADLTRVPNTP